MDEKENRSTTAGSPREQTTGCDDKLMVSALPPTQMQALAEKVMVLLKRELQIERERLHGR
jgi:hypothetical protein